MLSRLIVAAALLLSLSARAQSYDDDDGLNEAPRQGPSVDDFRDDPALAENGQWIDTPEYGTVWQPANVAEGWRPYYAGRWAYTTAGWAWMSDEPFGWAVYHYGRWAFEPEMGWVWLPGSVWAPAWVSWRWGDGYAGWCPLGPRNVYGGASFAGDGRSPEGAAYYEQPQVWVFVEQRNFLQPVPHYAVPIASGARVWAAPVRGPRAGPVIHAVEQQTGRGIRPMPIADAPRPYAGAAPVARGFTGSATSPSTGGAATFYRPRSVPVGQVGAPYMRSSPAQVEPRVAPHPANGGGWPAPASRSATPGPRPAPQGNAPAAPVTSPANAPAPHAAPAPHPHQPR